MDLALFDFDGTITNRESIGEFIKFILGREFFFRMMPILPSLFLYLIGLYGNKQIKEKALTLAISGMEISKLEKKAQEFSSYVLPRFIREKAVERLRWHKDKGDDVVIVSAGLGIYIRPWAQANGIDKVIAMDLEVDRERCTGRLIGENCYGKEKVERIKREIKLDKYDKIYAYGDSRGDREMLAIADEAYYRPFK